MSRFEIKIVAALLLIAVIPTVASVVLVGQVIRVSDGVSRGQIERLSGPLEEAADGYRRLFSALKTTFRLRATLLAADPRLKEALSKGPEPLRRQLAQVLGEHADLVRLVVRDGAGVELARAEQKVLPLATQYRDIEPDVPLGGAGHRLLPVFITDRKPFADFEALGRVQSTSEQLALLKGELTVYYRVVFVIMFGAVLLAATVLGLFVARRTARRVAVLALATRRVAGGDLETQVDLRARDELGDLANAFNEMVLELRESRGRIAYLEKIGAWQQIARRLAHEIKNPLTPIQLAVQQLHSKYDGGDPRFSQLLSDARDIITEEVDGLRRLVQAFSAFAKLPDVKPEPVELNGLIDDFLKSRSEIQQTANILWGPLDPPVTVMVDRMLIKHVLFNLVENAIQAAEGAGVLPSLQVSLGGRSDPERRRLLLQVADNGPGMDEPTVQRIFEPYYTTREHGTGLGLAIVKKIVLEHQGSIEVSSRPGRGACFTISLPLAAGPPTDRRKKTN